MRATTAVFLLLASAAFLTPAASAAYSLSNAGFESGFGSWTSGCGGGVCPELRSPGVGSASAVWIQNSNTGSYVTQAAGASAHPRVALEFDGKSLGGGTNIGENAAVLWSETGSYIVARIAFSPRGLVLYAFTTGTAFAVTEAPTDGAWHRYRAEADPATGNVTFSRDGIHVQTYQGAPRSLGSLRVYLGDTAGCDCAGLGGEAPTAMFDNVAVTGVAAAPPPLLPVDLRVTSLAVTGSPAAATRTVTATIRNEGSGPAAAFDVVLSTPYQGVDWTIGTATRPGLAAGATTTVTATWSVTGKIGTWMVEAAADPDDDVAETTEANNRRATSTTILVAGPAIDVFDP